MTQPSVFSNAIEKMAQCRRLDRPEALALAQITQPDQFLALGQAAYANRTARFKNRATFVYNLHINPSNLCEGGCRFCGYAKKQGEADAYVLSENQILEQVSQHKPAEVHIVGGLNHTWTFERSLRLIQLLRDRFSHIFIKAFTAVELDWFARQANLDSQEVLRQLVESGVDGLPGGGAEVFAKRIRDKLCPNKLTPQGFLEIHQQAHQLGIGTNATMLAGLGETVAERVDHLFALRQAQDQSGGFISFIPLFYQTQKPGQHQPLSPMQRLVIIALARAVLDNFPHIKAYWPMLGLETAATALSFGADDLDGTLGKERIVHAAGAKTPKSLALERLAQTVRIGGFQPMERDGAFRPIERLDS